MSNLNTGFFPFVVIFLLFLPFLPGCGGGEQRPPNIFVDYVTSNPATLDPARATDFDQARVQSKIFNGLLRYQTDLTIVPDLAASWTLSADGRLYTFHLRKNVRFHGGQPFTARDVAYSFNRLASKETASPRAWVLEPVQGFKDCNSGATTSLSGLATLDELTIQITLENPFAPFSGFLAMPATYILSERAIPIDDNPAHGKWVNGTGPFKFGQWNDDLSLDLVVNPDYFGRKPKLSGYRFRILSQSQVQEAAFLAGEIDSLELRDVNYQKFSQDPVWRTLLHPITGMNVFYLGFNCQKPPFDNPKVRQAFNHAINREALLKSYKNSQGILAKGSIPPTLPGYDPNRQPYSLDPQRATQLLKESGLPLPLRAEVWMKPVQENLDIMQAIQDQLKQASIEITIKKIDWAMLKEAIHKGEPDMYFLSWFADYPDPENFLAPLFHSKNWGHGGNRARFKDLDIDRKIEAMQRETDEKKRADACHEIDRAVFEQAPWVYLWHDAKTVVVAPHIRNFRASPIVQAEKGEDLAISVGTP